VKTDGGMRVELAIILAACSTLQFINPVFGVTAVVVLATIAALVVVWNSAFGRRFRLRLLAVRALPSRFCRRWRDKEPWLRWPARLTPSDTRPSTFINSCIATRCFSRFGRLGHRGLRKAQIAVVECCVPQGVRRPCGVDNSWEVTLHVCTDGRTVVQS
jgi:hypothetical protein